MQKCTNSFRIGSDTTSASYSKHGKKVEESLPLPSVGLHELDVVVLVVRTGFRDHVLDALVF